MRELGLAKPGQRRLHISPVSPSWQPSSVDSLFDSVTIATQNADNFRPPCRPFSAVFTALPSRRTAPNTRATAPAADTTQLTGTSKRAATSMCQPLLPPPQRQPPPTADR